MSHGLRVLLRAGDPVRRQGLAAMLEAAGHSLVSETPDVVLCDLARDAEPPGEAEAPVHRADRPAACPASSRPACCRVRSPPRSSTRRCGRWRPDCWCARRAALPPDGFRAAGDDAPPLLTPREAEILTLVGQGMSNKAAARALGISVHTVKFHLEALFAKLDATSRAEAVAKGLRGGVIEL